jgi:hypothetical protein
MGSKTLNFKETVSRMVIFKSVISGARFLPENFRRGMLSVVSVGTAQAARVPQWIHFFPGACFCLGWILGLFP